MTIREIIDSLEFIEAYKFKLYGRYPKVGNVREVKILEKIFRTGKRVRDYAAGGEGGGSNEEETSGELRGEGAKDHREGRRGGYAESYGRFYYRAAGGRYFNIVTLEAIGTSAEREYRAKYAELIAASLSTSLFWFYQQAYTDGLNLKGYEVDSFPLPEFEKVSTEARAEIIKLYRRYLDEIEKNAETKKVAEDSKYNVKQFKEYRLARSKKLIDEIDDLVGPLYGLDTAEVEYIKTYEEDMRKGRDVLQ